MCGRIEYAVDSFSPGALMYLVPTTSESSSIMLAVPRRGDNFSIGHIPPGRYSLLAFDLENNSLPRMPFSLASTSEIVEVRTSRGKCVMVRMYNYINYRDLLSSCNCNIESRTTCHVNSYVILAHSNPIKPLGHLFWEKIELYRRLCSALQAFVPQFKAILEHFQTFCELLLVCHTTCVTDLCIQLVRQILLRLVIYFQQLAGSWGK